MKRQVALDTETTGKSDDGTPGEHRIIEVGCVEIIDRKLTGSYMLILKDQLMKRLFRYTVFLMNS